MSLLNKRHNYLNFSSKSTNCSPNIITNLIKAQVVGYKNTKNFYHPDFFKLILEQKKTLGHLAPVHCVCYDQTSDYIFTVNIYLTLFQFAF